LLISIPDEHRIAVMLGIAVGKDREIMSDFFPTSPPSPSILLARDMLGIAVYKD
jgi:hypothetical protein